MEQIRSIIIRLSFGVFWRIAMTAPAVLVDWLVTEFEYGVVFLDFFQVSRVLSFRNRASTRLLVDHAYSAFGFLKN